MWGVSRLRWRALPCDSCCAVIQLSGLMVTYYAPALCMLLQALLASSHLLHEIQKNAANHGVIVDGARIDIPKMMAQKDKAVMGLTKGVEGLFKKNKVCFMSQGSILVCLAQFHPITTHMEHAS